MRWLDVDDWAQKIYVHSFFLQNPFGRKVVTIFLPIKIFLIIFYYRCLLVPRRVYFTKAVKHQTIKQHPTKNKRTLNKLPTELRCRKLLLISTNWAYKSAPNACENVCATCTIYSNWASILHTTIAGWVLELGAINSEMVSSRETSKPWEENAPKRKEKKRKEHFATTWRIADLTCKKKCSKHFF